MLGTINPEILFLQQEDQIKAGLLDMKMILKITEDTYKMLGQGQIQNPPKVHLGIPEGTEWESFFNTMPSYIGGDLNIAGIKWAAESKKNATTPGIPYGIDISILSDPVTVLPFCIQDGTIITAMRTSAVAGLQAKYCAPSDTDTATLIGAGVIGRTMIMAICEAIPTVKTIYLCDLDLEKAEQVAKESEGKYGVTIIPTSDSKAAAAKSQLIVGETTARTPFIDKSWVKPHSAIVCVSNEATTDVVKAADVNVVDYWKQIITFKNKAITQVFDAGEITKEEVLEEFYQVCLAQQYIAEGGIGYAKELLEKALGNDKAQGVIAKLTASLQVRPFEFIRKTDPAQLLNFIQDEHPQTIAMILSYLAPAQASQVLGALPPEKQADVAKRIATMDRTSPDVIKEVERVLERKLASLVNQDYTIVGGIDAIVGILNSVDRGTEKHIMESLEIEEPELADEIRKKMFVFEDILLLDDRAIQRVLRDVENADLELALKNTTEEVQNVIYKNLSKRLAAMIKEDMDFMGPVRMKDVEEAQQKIVAVIRKLEDAGEIVISRGGGDDIVV